MSRKKDQSEIGRTVQTRDENFEGQGDYRKPGYEKKGNYRKAVVVAQHGKNLALVKATKGSPRGLSLKDDKVTKFKPYVETKDDEGNPIQYGSKFIPNRRKKKFSKQDIIIVILECFTENKNLKKRNRNKVREMKGRPPIK